MHKLMEYICDELEELERKADKNGKLSMAEIEYADKLAHIKKSLLTADELWEDSEYSNAMDGQGGDGNSYRYYSRRGGSYARGGQGGGSYARGRGRNARRDSMGRYSRDGGYSYGADDMVQELRELMQDAPDDRTRQEFERFIQKIEQM